MAYPVLYSFRRCPYAMRARMALAYAGITCEMRDILLRDKPDHMLEISPKGTVPVLLLPDGTVLEESLDIMYWALDQNDPDGWRNIDDKKSEALIHENDTSFKHALNLYKYPDRDTSRSQQEYREAGEAFLQRLEDNLKESPYLLGGKVSIADIALFPFIRQFAGVDTEWFESASYPHLKKWLNSHLESDLFATAMTKYTPWKPGDAIVLFPLQ